MSKLGRWQSGIGGAFAVVLVACSSSDHTTAMGSPDAEAQSDGTVTEGDTLQPEGGGGADAGHDAASTDSGTKTDATSGPGIDSGPAEAGEDGSEADAGEDAEAGCAPVTHYVYTSTSTVPLGCDGNSPATLVDAVVPQHGHAVARATFSVQHTGANDVTHYWSIQVHVGTAVDAEGVGDDVCPGTTSARGNMGYGVLTAAKNHATLVGNSGASPCTPGTLQVLAGAEVEVWVEDNAPGCVGGDIAFADYYAVNGDTALYDWTTSFTPLPGMSASLTTTGASEKMRVMGVVEGSPNLDPNMVCGSEVSTIDMGTLLDSSPMVYLREVVPASQGEGHRVIFTDGDADEIRDVTPGMHTASLVVATDFVNGSPVTTGGCCGGGDIALIRLR
jgi:hypothetical protein